MVCVWAGNETIEENETIESVDEDKTIEEHEIIEENDPLEVGERTGRSGMTRVVAYVPGYQRRQRRSEEELKQASDMVARGMTFQVASEKYKIPISTIRFYMVRKGILQRRKRGRGSSNLGGVNLQPTSPASPPFHMMNYRLPEGLNSSVP